MQYVATATNKAAKERELRSHRIVINMRKRILDPIFGGWRDVVTAQRRLRARRRHNHAFECDSRCRCRERLSESAAFQALLYSLQAPTSYSRVYRQPG